MSDDRVRLEFMAKVGLLKATVDAFLATDPDPALIEKAAVDLIDIEEKLEEHWDSGWLAQWMEGR